MGQLLIAWLAILFFVIAFVSLIGGIVAGVFLLWAVPKKQISRIEACYGFAVGLVASGISVGAGYLLSNHNVVGDAIWSPPVLGPVSWAIIGFVWSVCPALLVLVLTRPDR